jgi:hypothetical protein
MPIMLAFDADQDVSHVLAKAQAEKVCAASRYLKNLQPHEVAAISAAGIKIISIFETTARRAAGGAVAGAADGEKAAQMARALNQPAGSAIYATADWDVTPAQQPRVLEYFAAFKTALNATYAVPAPYKLGVYANGAVCQATLDQGIADYTWLAAGMGMTGSRAFLASGKATMVQNVGDKQRLDLGISIDSDTIATTDFGGWNLSPAPAAA